MRGNGGISIGVFIPRRLCGSGAVGTAGMGE